MQTHNLSNASLEATPLEPTTNTVGPESILYAAEDYTRSARDVLARIPVTFDAFEWHETRVALDNLARILENRLAACYYGDQPEPDIYLCLEEYAHAVRLHDQAHRLLTTYYRSA